MSWSAGGGTLTSSGVLTSATTTAAVTLTGVNAGELVVIGMYYRSVQFASLAVDTGEAINFGVTQTTGNSHVVLFGWFKAGASGSKTITLTVSSASAAREIWAKSYAYTGADFAFDAISGVATSGTSSATTNVVTSANNALVLGWVVSEDVGTAPVVGANYTALAIADASNASLHAEEDLDGGTAGTIAVNFTVASGFAHALTALAFRELSTAPKFNRKGHVDSKTTFAAGATVACTATAVQDGEMVVVGMYVTGATLSGVVSSTGETIVVGSVQTTTSNSHRVQLGRFKAVGTGDRTITLTVSSAAGVQRGVWADWYSCTGGGPGFDVEGGAIATSATPSVSVTTTKANALIVGYCAAESAADPVAGSSYGLISIFDPTNAKLSAEYNADVGAAGSKTVNFSITSSAWAVVSLALSESFPGDDIFVSDSVSIKIPTLKINVNDTITASDVGLPRPSNPTRFSLATAHQDSGQISTGTTTVTVAITCNAGEMVVIDCEWEAGATSFSSLVTTSGESVLLGTAVSISSNSYSIRKGWFKATSTGSRTITLTLTVSGLRRRVRASAWGCGGGGPGFVAESTNTGTSVTPSTSLVATDDNLILGYCIVSATTEDPVEGIGFIGVPTTEVAGGKQHDEYALNAGLAGTKTVGFTALNNNWGVTAVAFQQNLVGDDITTSESVTVVIPVLKPTAFDTITTSEVRAAGVFGTNLWSFVNSADSGAISSAGLLVSATITGVQAGDVLAIGVYHNFGSVSGITVDGGEAAVSLGTGQIDNNHGVRCGWLAPVVNSGTKVVQATVTSTGQRRQLAVVCFRPVSMYEGTFDSSNSVVLSTTTTPSVNVTTSQDGDAIFGFYNSGNLTEPTPGSGYTFIDLANSDNTRSAVEYRVNAGAAGTVAVDWTTTASSSVLGAVAFKSTLFIPSDTVTASDFVSVLIPRHRINVSDGITTSDSGSAPPVSASKFVLATPHQDSGVITSVGPSVTVDISANAGEMVVIDCAWEASSFTSLVTSSGETVTLGTKLSDSNGVNTLRKGWFKAESSGSRTITFTTPAGTLRRRVRASAWSCGAGGPLFVSESASQSFSTAASTTLTVTDDNLVLGYCYVQATTEPVEGAGFVGVATVEVSPASFQHDEYVLNAGPAGSKVVDFSTPNTRWVVTAVAFEQGAVGDGVTVSDAVNLGFNPIFISKNDDIVIFEDLGANFPPQVSDGVTVSEDISLLFNPFFAVAFDDVSVSGVGVPARVSFGQPTVGEDVIISDGSPLLNIFNPKVPVSAFSNVEVSDSPSFYSFFNVNVGDDITVDELIEQLDHQIIADHVVVNSLRVTVSHTISNGNSVFTSHTIITTFEVLASHTISNSLQTRILVGHTIVNSLTLRVQVGHTVSNELRSNNQVSTVHVIRNTLIDSIVVVHSITGVDPRIAIPAAVEQIYLLHFGFKIVLLEASVSQDENDGLWNARLALAEASDFLRLFKRSPVTLVIYGDSYEMVVESLTVSRQSRVQRTFEVNCKSPAWLTLGREAPQVNKTWGAVSAYATVAELVGAAVDWQIADWIIPDNKLAAVNQSPLDVVRTIVDTAGAVVESHRGGMLRVRYRYPVSIPSIPLVTPDQTLTEGTDVFTSETSSPDEEVFDKVVVSDSQEEDGFLTAEADPDNPSVIIGGEQQGFVVYKDDKVDILGISLSDGSLVGRGTKFVDVEEQVTFINTNTQQVSKPVHSELTWTWYGAGLGSLTANGRTLTASSSGVAVAKVSYKSQSLAYAVQSPTTSGGENSFPIVVVVVGGIR